MGSELIRFNQMEIDRIVGDGVIENANLSTTKKGYKKLEIQVYFPDSGCRKFFVLKDKGYLIDRREVMIKPFDSKKARDREIRRLYIKEKLTQAFIGKIFGLTQPTISAIINS